MKDKFCNDSSSASINSCVSKADSIEQIIESVTAVTTNLTLAASSVVIASSASSTTASTHNPSTSTTSISCLSASQNDINYNVEKEPVQKYNDPDKLSAILVCEENIPVKANFKNKSPKFEIESECSIATYGYSSGSDNEDYDEDSNVNPMQMNKIDALKNSKAPSSKRRKTKMRDILIEQFEKDYDNQIDYITEKAAKTIENDDSCMKCGLYQFISFIFISIAWSTGTGMYAYLSVFTGYTPNMSCDIEQNSSSLTTNYTFDEENCYYTDTYNNVTQSCTKWIYDESQMKSTIITEYNFVCKNNYKFEVAYSIEQVGYIIGTLIFSVIADRIGRKPVFVGVLIAMSVTGIIQFFISNFYVYMSLGFILNIFAAGLDSVCVPLVLEIVRTSRRTGFGIGMEYVWVFVLTLLSPTAMLINKWRYLRLFIFIILSVIAFCSFWLVQESLTWLISTAKLNRAKSVIDFIAKFNRLKSTKFLKQREKLFEYFNLLAIYTDARKKLHEKLANCRKESSINLSSNTNKLETRADDGAAANETTFIDLLKHPKYRLYVIIMSMNWFSTSLIYDGLTYLNSTISDNIFVTWVLMNMIELPAQIMCHFCLARFGRRLTTCVSLIVCGGTLIVITFLTSIVELKSLNWLKFMLFLIAKFSSSHAYSAVILHSPEIFPTHLRSFGYGVCLFSGKVTAVISPIISLYLTKLVSWLPPVIYGVIAILCGCVCLYVPETLNRPLPNSIEDVLKWPRGLTDEERKKARQLSQINCNIFKNLKKFVSRKKCASISVEPKLSSHRNSTQNTIIYLGKNELQNS